MIAIDNKNMVITLKEYNEKKINVDLNLLEFNYNMKYNFKNKNYVFKISFTNNTKENIKILKALKRLVKKNIQFGVDYDDKNLLGIVENSNREIEDCIKAIFIQDIYKKYEFSTILK